MLPDGFGQTLRRLTGSSNQGEYVPREMVGELYGAVERVMLAGANRSRALAEYTVLDV